MISEEEYLGLIETLYLTSIPGMKEEVVSYIISGLVDRYACEREETVSLGFNTAF